MVILSAIGRFFQKIWQWIRDTAWVQPLLIVGAIFAVMFSIIPIVDGIKGLAEDLNSSEAFYTQFQQSLENGADSSADKITKWILNETETQSKDYSAYGEKFFLTFVSESCASCAEAREGFEYLRNNFTGSMAPEDGLPFKMYTIFTDEVTDYTTSSATAFVQYMDRNPYFFESAASSAYQSEYYLNGFIDDSNLEAMESCDPDNFLTPTTILVDFTGSSPEYGFSEVFFAVSGDSTYEKAQFILDCWNHDGDFGEN